MKQCTTYRIFTLISNGKVPYFCPQYLRVEAQPFGWKFYNVAPFATWNEAYDYIEKQANPAALAVRFVGTF